MIKAKVLMLTRFTCSLIFVIAFLIVFLFDSIAIHNMFFKIIFFTSFTFFFILLIGISLESEFFRNHSRIFLLITILGCISAVINLILTNINELCLNSFIIFSTLIGVLSWSYALSINKKKKIRFCFLGSLYYLINLIVQFNLQLTINYLFSRFLALNLVLLSIALILLAEYIMKRKKYLKYI